MLVLSLKPLKKLNGTDRQAGRWVCATRKIWIRAIIRLSRFCPGNIGQIFESYNFPRPQVSQIQVGFHFSIRMSINSVAQWEFFFYPTASYLQYELFQQTKNSFQLLLAACVHTIDNLTLQPCQPGSNIVLKIIVKPNAQPQPHAILVGRFSGLFWQLLTEQRVFGSYGQKAFKTDLQVGLDG